MKIAVEGCAHGELDKIYESLLHLQDNNSMKIDLLICCGDFQAVRNSEDLQCMAVPQKYLSMNTFYKYYSGEAKAPIMTLFVGGNHEASNYLGELAYGGWVCPNIYYLGYAGIININGVRIAGVSGIYKGPDYLKGHFEAPPYDKGSKHSAYHIRNIETFRMKQVCEPIAVFLSHDWPRGVYNHGNVEDLLRKKRFFREEVEANKLGSRPNQELLEKLKPAYWFAAHLHVKFAALVPHKQDEDGARKTTKFMALDKCLPRRDFLQILDIGPKVGPEASLELSYDAEWLAILKSTDHLLNTSPSIRYMPGPGSAERWNFAPTEEELLQVSSLFAGDFRVPANFQQTVPAYDPASDGQRPMPARQPPIRTNPQTTEFCAKLGITDPWRKLMEVRGQEPEVDFAPPINPNQSELDVTFGEGLSMDRSLHSTNPDEISLLDDDDDDDQCPAPATALMVTGSPAIGRLSIFGALPIARAAGQSSAEMAGELSPPMTDVQTSKMTDARSPLITDVQSSPMNDGHAQKTPDARSLIVTDEPLVQPVARPFKRRSPDIFTEEPLQSPAEMAGELSPPRKTNVLSPTMTDAQSPKMADARSPMSEDQSLMVTDEPLKRQSQPVAIPFKRRNRDVYTPSTED